MLIMRPISAIAGLLILIMLSRVLSSTDYGNFFAFWAIVEILILASNLGLIHAVYRYVSATEQTDGVILTTGPIWHLVWWRFCTLAFTGFVFMLIPDSIASLSKVSIFSGQILLCLIAIVFFEGIARFFESIFDSMLCQGRSQISLVSRTFFRLIGYLIFLSLGSMDLQHVLYADVIATALGALIAVLMLWDVSRKSRLSGRQTQKENISFSRMTRFAMPAFAAQVLTLVYGPDALKLILSNTSGTTELALFGFAYSLAAVVQRYIPANLLAGVFRPIFVAGSKKQNADTVLSELLSISIKLNWLVILPIFCFLFFGGTSLLEMLSGGNYSDAGNVIAIIMLGLLAISTHLTFSMYCLARETSLPVLYATVASTLGLPLGIILAENYGATGVAVAFGISELIWSTTCFAVLRYNASNALTLDWLGLIKLLLGTLFVVVFCSLIKSLGVNWWFFLAIFAPLMFIIVTYFSKVFSEQEKVWLMSVLPISQIASCFRPLR